MNHKEIVNRLPKTKDGVPVVPGDKVWFVNTDKSYWGEDSAIEQTVSSISINDPPSTYDGSHVVGCDNWEGGNLECYSKLYSITANDYI